MKKPILILAVSAALFAQIVGPGTITATVASSGTPVRLTTTNIQAKSFAVQLTAGTATICVGASTVSESSGTGTCVTGTTLNIYYPPSDGLVYDLSLYYVDASANSTVVTVNYNVQ